MNILIKKELIVSIINNYLICVLILITIILFPLIFKEFLNKQKLQLEYVTDTLEQNLSELFLYDSNNIEVYKRFIRNGEQYIIKIPILQLGIHYFVLSIYEKYNVLEIPNSGLKKKLLLNSKDNHYVKTIIEEAEKLYILQQNERDCHDAD